MYQLEISNYTEAQLCSSGRVFIVSAAGIATLLPLSLPAKIEAAKARFAAERARPPKRRRPAQMETPLPLLCQAQSGH